MQVRPSRPLSCSAPDARCAPACRSDRFPAPRRGRSRPRPWYAVPAPAGLAGIDSDASASELSNGLRPRAPRWATDVSAGELRRGNFEERVSAREWWQEGSAFSAYHADIKEIISERTEPVPTTLPTNVRAIRIGTDPLTGASRTADAAPEQHQRKGRRPGPAMPGRGCERRVPLARSPRTRNIGRPGGHHAEREARSALLAGRLKRPSGERRHSE